MRGMILAAGRGLRMRELTLDTPKPLLQVKGRYLIEYSILALAAAGISEIVINVSYFAEKIKKAMGDGSRYGVSIQYSEEVEALETGGGIFQALPLLGESPFVVLSCDVVTDFDLKKLPKDFSQLAHLVLVDNPAYHPMGDFGLVGDEVKLNVSKTYTFGNIGVYRPELFADCQAGRFRLGDVLKKAVLEGRVSGEYFQGAWFNLGAPEDLKVFEESSPSSTGWRKGLGEGGVGDSAS